MQSNKTLVHVLVKGHNSLVHVTVLHDVELSKQEVISLFDPETTRVVDVYKGDDHA